MGFFSPRRAETTIKCPACHKELEIVRSCHEAHMHCPHCGKNYPLRDFIHKADKAMENFLDACYLDRL